MPNTFFQGAKIFLGGFHLPAPPWLQACNKYVMGVWSNNFTAAFFVSFIVTVFVPDSAVVAQLSPPECLQGPPNGDDHL